MNAIPRYVSRGEGPPVVLLHGVGGLRAAWRPQLDALADRYRVVAWDMPGYGGEDVDEPMTFEGLGAALGALLDDLGEAPVHLVGHSMGGMVAQEFAVTGQDRLASLTLFATSPSFGRPDGDFQKKFVADRLRPLDDGRGMAGVADGAILAALVGPLAEPGALEAVQACMARVPEAAYRAAVHCITTFERRAALGAIGVPTLVIAGEVDPNAPAPMMERMAAKIPGARFVCMAGTGHFGNLERPDEFNTLVAGFIEQARGALP